MPRNTEQYLFARLSLQPIKRGKERQEEILAGLNGTAIKHKGLLWSFFDLSELEVDGQRFLQGKLVKYSPEGQEKVADEEQREIHLQDIRNVVEAESPFFIHLGEEETIVAFHPVVSAISQKTFRARFIELYRRAHNNFFVDPDLELINERLAIWEALRRFEKILRFKVKLHRPNPSTREEWKKVAEDLEEKNAKEYREEYVADKDSSGLDIADDDEIRGKVLMAEDGYGEASVTGLLNGKRSFASTSKSPVSAQVAKLEATEQGKLEVLIETFRKIWSRFD